MAIFEQPSPPKAHSMDDIITNLGIGAWNYLYFVVAALGQMAFTVNLLGAEFMAPTLKFACIDPQDSHPLNSNECFVYPLHNSSTTPAPVTCSRFWYDNSTYVSTLTAEFDMVCSRDRLKDLFQMLFTLGCMVGCPLGGIIADRYGRQTAVFYGSLLTSVAVVVMTTVSSLPGVMVARFFIGLFFMFFDSPSYTIGMEACPLKHRFLYGVIVGIPYALSVTGLAGIAWLSRRWRMIQLTGSLPLFVLVILSSPCVLWESPRWLLSQGRLQEAEAGLRRAASLNSSFLSLPDDLPGTLLLIHGNQNDSTGAEKSLPECQSLVTRVRSLVTHPSMRRVTLIVMLVWLLLATLYLSIPLRSDIFESPFAYVALLGIAEIPAYTVSASITKRVGRKPFLVGCLLLIAAVEAILVILVFVGLGAAWPSIIMASFGYSLICCAFQMSMLYLTELFPTTVRSLGMSVALFMSSVGYNLPSLLDMALPKELLWLPLAIYCAVACITAGLHLLLPETIKRPLMQSVQEHINYTQENKQKMNTSHSGKPHRDAAKK